MEYNFNEIEKKRLESMRPKIVFILLFISVFSKLSGQIMNDSTVQVIGYWDKNEKQTYLITFDKYKISASSDTTERNSVKYYVDITVVDSTENSYLIDWLYRDYEIVTDNEWMKKFYDLSKKLGSCIVRIKTDELGAFQEIVNWEDVKNYMMKLFEMFEKEQLNTLPNGDELIQEMKNRYSSKEVIERATIDEIHLFYSFHGSIYKLGEEYSTTDKVSNNYGGEPFDAYMNVWLDEIDKENDSFLMRYYQAIDGEQITEAAKEQVKKIAKLTTGQEIPELTDKLEGLPEMRHETHLMSYLHGSGWVLFLTQLKEVSANNILGVEELTIDLQ